MSWNLEYESNHTYMDLCDKEMSYAIINLFFGGNYPQLCSGFIPDSVFRYHSWQCSRIIWRLNLGRLNLSQEPTAIQPLCPCFIPSKLFFVYILQHFLGFVLIFTCIWHITFNLCLYLILIIINLTLSCKHKYVVF